MGLSVNIPLSTYRRFEFEDFSELKRIWDINVGLKNERTLKLVISKHEVMWGFWLQPINAPNLPEDIVFQYGEIPAFIQKLNREVELNRKTKRMFMISYGTVSAAIVTTNGLVTGYAPIFKWMFGKTLQEIKPWILKQKGIKVQELNVTSTEIIKKNKS